MTETEPREKDLRSTLRRMRKVYGSILGISWDVARSRSAALSVTMVLLALWGAGSSLLTKLVIDAVATESPGAFALGVVFVAIVAAFTLLQDGMGIIAFDLADRITNEVERRVMRISAEAPGLEHLERPEYADKLKVVRDHSHVPLNAVFNANSLLYLIFGIGAAVVLLGTIQPVLSLMPAAALPGAILQFRAHRKHLDRFDETAPEERLAAHYLEISTGVQAAKEVRLFGLGPHIIDRHKKLTDAYNRKLLNDRLKRSWAAVAGGAIYGASMAATIAYIGYLASQGRATPGDIALGVSIIRQMIGQVHMAASVLAWLAELSFVGERYLWMLDYKSQLEIRPRELLAAAPKVIRHGITVENVSFTYPGTEKVVLEDVSFFMPAASTTALVGENGAGKSSLVKLLFRFYDPTQGRLLIDGMDLRDMDLEGWRSRSAVAFQDFIRPQLVAREAVSVGDLNAIEDQDRVLAASRHARADQVIDRLPHQYDTQLGREFEGGVELSEGEWQRVALARGSMPRLPALVVLDEPTASLDAKAEHEVFERFAEIAGGTNGSKPVTVLVSHRFSTVRMADLIVVLHEGKIEEIGSHEDLVAREGRYAELFALQASRYT